MPPSLVGVSISSVGRKGAHAQQASKQKFCFTLAATEARHTREWRKAFPDRLLQLCRALTEHSTPTQHGESRALVAVTLLTIHVLPANDNTHEPCCSCTKSSVAMLVKSQFTPDWASSFRTSLENS